MSWINNIVSSAILLLSSLFGSSQVSPPVFTPPVHPYTVTSSHTGTTTTLSNPDPTQASAANTVTYAGLSFTYPPGWTEDSLASDKGTSEHFYAPRNASSTVFITQMQATADSQSNLNFKGGSIAYQEKYGPSGGQVQMPDLYLPNLGVTAKVWQTKDLFTQDNPAIIYFIPINNDIISIIVVLDSEHLKETDFKGTQDFINQFLGNISVHKS
ncbi:MAG: hypothetical protein JWM39_735 [Parcubacteria group bacterium]|nr:hypothetical protein [Parcubacteria group bacterium]